MIGDRIKYERKLRGQTQEQVARSAGVSVHTVSSLEMRNYDARLLTAAKIASSFGISLDSLVQPVTQEEWDALKRDKAA